MRRSVLAAIGTIAGTALMVGAKLGTAPSGVPAAAAVSDNVAGLAGPSASAPAAGNKALAANTANPAPANNMNPAPADNTNPAPGNPPAPAGGGTTATLPPQPGAGGRKDGSYTASAGVQKYGYPVSVTVTVAGGRITAATGSCGGVSGQSLAYCTNAMSRLQQEALTAQSASVNTVSGATYTSMAYRTSLQAALDQA
jgi:uncharacterized protein with FMN-binding domain